ncbi:MAG: uroporphyrinogen-III C-methyltransferase [Verrucomicrobiae bacterium]|nr:uroporphyrinogen-III C-methyltransferase [Verrucomicrobiae bacterium]
MKKSSAVFRAATAKTDSPPQFATRILSHLRTILPSLRLQSQQIPSPDAGLGALRAGKLDILILRSPGDATLHSAGIDWFRLSPAENLSATVFFKARTPGLMAWRGLFTKAVTFVGAGVGDARHITVAGLNALRQADVCLYDALLDEQIFDLAPAAMQRISVGKRCGHHLCEQPDITQLMLDYARQGLRVVRLKGGDPGFFGRLAEETAALDRHQLAYRVIPGVSSLNMATTGTGMLLTRRGVSRGFCVMTPRHHSGQVISVSHRERAALPMVFFMAIHCLDEVIRQLRREHFPATTPCALVFNAGTPDEIIIRGQLDRISQKTSSKLHEQPGLFLVGEITRFARARQWGPLAGKRVLLTCTPALQEIASTHVTDLGGHPISFPLVRLVPTPSAADTLKQAANYDWLLITSPSSAQCLETVMRRNGLDLRRMPRIMTSGKGTARELIRMGLQPDVTPPKDAGATGILRMAKDHCKRGERILRLQSDKADPHLTAALRQLGLKVTEAAIFQNETIRHPSLPGFDIVFFTSGSTVESFLGQWGAAPLENKTILAIGAPTARVLRSHQIQPTLVSPAPGIREALLALAAAQIGFPHSRMG